MSFQALGPYIMFIVTVSMIEPYIVEVVLTIYLEF